MYTSHLIHTLFKTLASAQLLDFFKTHNWNQSAKTHMGALFWMHEWNDCKKQFWHGWPTMKNIANSGQSPFGRWSLHTKQPGWKKKSHSKTPKRWTKSRLEFVHRITYIENEARRRREVYMGTLRVMVKTGHNTHIQLGGGCISIPEIYLSNNEKATVTCCLFVCSCKSVCVYLVNRLHSTLPARSSIVC